MARMILRAALVLMMAVPAAADEGPNEESLGESSQAARKLTSQELADWIDQRFAAEYERLGVEPAEIVDDATFLRRAFLDLQGRIPMVAQARDFLNDENSFKRQDYVDRLLANDRPPERFAQRSAEHLGRVWRRMLVPASAPNAAMAPQLDPWLASQFAANTPYNEFARKLLLSTPAAPMMDPTTQATPNPDAAAALFQQAVGVQPENLAGAYVRVFLGVRIQCAQCHDHPMAEWTQNDFWGMAALLGAAGQSPTAPTPAPTIKPDTEDVTYTAKLLWSDEPLREIPAGKSPRELLADWMVSPDNPNFAATAVNRVWQYLCGRGLVGSVEDLDQVSDEERKILDDLAKLFVDSGYDVAWLITGICKSKVYQQTAATEEGLDGEGFVHRPLKTLLPEQVFDSLEQALSLPVAKVDNGPRFNGERDQFVARMNESAAETPADFKGGIPQALMLMNGKLTADATSLDNSRTLRAVVEAPFLNEEAKIETLYLAVLTRSPTPEEMAFLSEHIQSKANEQERKQAYAEIYWGLLNSPEFVLSR